MITANDNAATEYCEDDMTVLKTKVNKVAVSSSQRLLEELPREKLAWMLQRMCEIRYFEEKAEDLYGFDHPSSSGPRPYDCQGRQPHIDVC
jgi:hypothetical protein